MIPDGIGGVIMVWEDPRSSTLAPDIYAQRFNRLGQPVWNPNGVAICTASNIQEFPRIATDGAGGAIIAWTDNRQLGGRNVYAQRIDAAGGVQWGALGTPVCVAANWQNDVRVVSDGAGGAIISWADMRNSATTDTDIYAQRLNASGTPQWTADGVVVCGATAGQVEHHIAPDGAGGAILVWQDWRVFSDIYAQRIDASGNPLWAADGILVCFPSYVAYPKVVSDTKGGAIIAWEDNRSSRNIYAQRLRPDGSPVWTVDGLAMCPSTGGFQRHMKLASDGEGGAVMAVVDDRPDLTVYAQKVDSLGNMVWGADGVGVCPQTDYQFWPDLVDDGAGGAIITWEDYRSATDTTDVYAQRITKGGAVAWAVDGVSISSTAGVQRQARIASDDNYGAYIAWVDERGTDKDIYVNHVNPDGLVPTFLAGFSTSITDNAITVRWRLSEAGNQLAHRVFRAEGNGEFKELTTSLAIRGLEYEMVDSDVAPGESYRYCVYADDADGSRMLFTTESMTVAPVTLVLDQNNPNPFNPGTMVSFTIPKAGRVTLNIFDVSGRHVRTIVDGVLTTGTKQFSWDGMDENGVRVSSGVYFYQLSFANKTLTKKMTLLK
jgi:hypothetical protein